MPLSPLIVGQFKCYIITLSSCQFMDLQSNQIGAISMAVVLAGGTRKESRGGVSREIEH